jgi:hypothetical protein
MLSKAATDGPVCWLFLTTNILILCFFSVGIAVFLPRTCSVDSLSFYRYRNFDLEYLGRVKSSEPLHTKMPLIILLVGITGSEIFSAEPCSNNCSWDYGLGSRIFEEIQQSTIQTEIELNFGEFFNK